MCFFQVTLIFRQSFCISSVCWTNVVKPPTYTSGLINTLYLLLNTLNRFRFFQTPCKCMSSFKSSLHVMMLTDPLHLFRNLCYIRSRHNTQRFYVKSSFQIREPGALTTDKAHSAGRMGVTVQIFRLSFNFRATILFSLTYRFGCLNRELYHSPLHMHWNFDSY
jgi:hypothetical protein